MQFYFPFSVVRSITTRLDYLSYSALLSDGTFVVTGTKGKTHGFRSYSLQTGKQLSSNCLKNALGLAEVKLGQDLALAISNRLVTCLYQWPDGRMGGKGLPS